MSFLKKVSKKENTLKSDSKLDSSPSNGKHYRSQGSTLQKSNLFHLIKKNSERRRRFENQNRVMHKEHHHFVKSYASHLNSKDKLSRSNKSDAASLDREGEAKDEKVNIFVNSQDLP